jgi:hypothetical protein
MPNDTTPETPKPSPHPWPFVGTLGEPLNFIPGEVGDIEGGKNPTVSAYAGPWCFSAERYQQPEDDMVGWVWSVAELAPGSGNTPHYRVRVQGSECVPLAIAIQVLEFARTRLNAGLPLDGDQLADFEIRVIR